MPSALEILLIFGALLLFFGGRKLPEMARNVAEARRAFDEEAPETDEQDESKTKTKEAVDNLSEARRAYEEERDRPRRASDDDSPSQE